MARFEISQKARELMAKDEKRLKTAIVKIAHEFWAHDKNRDKKLLESNFSYTRPSGISKYQGGVRINEYELCITRNHVCEDWKRNGVDGKDEEVATAKAIEFIAETLEDINPDFLQQYQECYVGDPLRSLLE